MSGMNTLLTVLVFKNGPKVGQPRLLQVVLGILPAFQAEVGAVVVAKIQQSDPELLQDLGHAGMHAKREVQPKTNRPMLMCRPFVPLKHSLTTLSQFHFLLRENIVFHLLFGPQGLASAYYFPSNLAVAASDCAIRFSRSCWF